MAQMQYDDPYENWKAKGRPGGSFDAWQGSQKTSQPQPQGPSQGGAVPRQPAAPTAQPGGVPDYSDPKAFQAWYNQQQGGSRSEDMDRFIRDPQGNLSGDTLKRWDPYLIREGPDAGKYRSMRGAEGVYDKPTECPSGMVPGGGSESDKCVPMPAWAGGSGGGGGQGGSGGAGGGGYGGNQEIYKYLKSSGLAAAQDPEVALKNYMGFGGSQQYSAAVDQARAQAMSLPRGPARDAAMARLEEQKFSGLQGMRQAASGQARNELLTGTMGQEFGYNQLGENARQADQQNALGWGGLDVQRQLGMGNLGLGYAQLGQQGTQFGQQMDYNKWATEGGWGQNALDRNLQQTLNQKNIDANKKGLFEKILGGVGAVTGSLGNIASGGGFKALFSDIRVKENISSGGRGLSELRKLPSYTYNYIWDEAPQQGIMAQDLEKVAPEMVGEFHGIKTVNPYGLLTMTMNAVKELDAKLAAKKGRK